MMRLHFLKKNQHCRFNRAQAGDIRQQPGRNGGEANQRADRRTTEDRPAPAPHDAQVRYDVIDCVIFRCCLLQVRRVNLVPK